MNNTTNPKSNIDTDTNFNKRQFWTYKKLYGSGLHNYSQRKKKNSNITKCNNANKIKNSGVNTDKKTKKIFHLVNNKITMDKGLIGRLNNLYIPPAYKDIVIAKSANNKIQAIGTDKRGRRQYIYHPSYTNKRNDRKYDDILELATKISAIEKDNDIDIIRLSEKPYSDWQLPSDYIPIIIYMLRKYHFRIGNERYALQNNSYGITTLKTNHILFNNDNTPSKITIEFVGKKGILNRFSDNNPTIISILNKLVAGVNNKKSNDGYLFKYLHTYPDNTKDMIFITPDDIQHYFQKQYNSYITPKMFRTWYGNYHLLEYLRKMYLDNRLKPHLNKKEKNQIISSCSEHVSSKLNNTPTVSKQSYIDNKILDLVMKNPYRLASNIPDDIGQQHLFLRNIIKKLRH
jgi:DNA topoisomerase-1